MIRLAHPHNISFRIQNIISGASPGSKVLGSHLKILLTGGNNIFGPQGAQPAYGAALNIQPLVFSN